MENPLPRFMIHSMFNNPIIKKTIYTGEQINKPYYNINQMIQLQNNILKYSNYILYLHYDFKLTYIPNINFDLFRFDNHEININREIIMEGYDLYNIKQNPPIPPTEEIPEDLLNKLDIIKIELDKICQIEKDLKSYFKSDNIFISSIRRTNRMKYYIMIDFDVSLYNDICKLKKETLFPIFNKKILYVNKTKNISFKYDIYKQNHDLVSKKFSIEESSIQNLIHLPIWSIHTHSEYPNRFKQLVIKLLIIHNRYKVIPKSKFEIWDLPISILHVIISYLPPI